MSNQSTKKRKAYLITNQKYVGVTRTTVSNVMNGHHHAELEPVKPSGKDP